MRCPFCSNEDSQVKDSRPTEDNTAIRRRRICEQCGSRFTTFERIQLRDLIVVKTNGQKESFDRDKMYRSLSLALRKRDIETEKIEKIVNAIVRKLENSGEGDGGSCGGDGLRAGGVAPRSVVRVESCEVNPMYGAETSVLFEADCRPVSTVLNRESSHS